MKQEIRRGKLYGIGVGPGAPELVTIKALRCIKESDIVILPSEPREDCQAYRIVRQIYPEIEQKKTISIPFPMIKEKEKLEEAHERILHRIRALLAEGNTLAFLTIGDPTVYSTYGYIHRKVTAEGGMAEIISGVPSFCAVAAELGISLGDGREEIHVIPASYDVAETLNWRGTKIYMKSGKHLAELKWLLSSVDAEVYAVSNCGMENQKIYRDAVSIDADSSYFTVVVVKEKE